MATLEKIRGRAALLVVVIGVALLAFLLGDLIRGGSTLFRDNQMVVMNVNGEKVKLHDFENRVNEVSENVKMMGNRTDLTEADHQQIRNQVFTAIVMENVLDKEANSLGLSISPAETYDLIQGNNISPIIAQSPLFINPQTGEFDKEILTNVRQLVSTKNIEATPEPQRSQLESYRRLWLGLENDVKQFRLSEKYNTLLSKGVVANKLDAQEFIEHDKNTAKIAYVSQTALALPDSVVNVTDSDLKAFYDSHKELFKVPAYRVLDIIYKNLQPSQDDILDAKEEIVEATKELESSVSNPQDVVAAYSENRFIDAYLPLDIFKSEFFYSNLADQLVTASIGEVLPIHESSDEFSVAKLIDKKIAPDSLFIRHILLARVPDSQERIDSVYNLASASPEKFGELAEEFSLDTNSSSNEGELGWVTELTAAQFLGPEIKDAIFSGPINKPFKYTSQFGEHIFLIDKTSSSKPLYKVAYITKHVTPGTDTYTEAYNEFSSFKASNHDVDSIGEAAINNGYQVLYNMEVYPSSTAVAQNIPNSRKLVQWAFNHKPGEVSDINEFEDKFVMGVLRKEIPQGYKPFEETKDEIRPVVTLDKKVDKMYSDINEKNISSLSDYASINNVPLDTINYVGFNSNRIDGIGFEPVLNAVAVAAPLNKPLTVKGNSAVYVLNVLDRERNNNPTVTENNAKDLFQTNLGGKVRMQALQYLMSKSKIEDNRAKFY